MVAKHRKLPRATTSLDTASPCSSKWSWDQNDILNSPQYQPTPWIRMSLNSQCSVCSVSQAMCIREQTMLGKGVARSNKNVCNVRSYNNLFLFNSMYPGSCFSFPVFALALVFCGLCFFARPAAIRVHHCKR
jgi:hypothetical protein